MTGYQEATFYAQVEPEWGRWRDKNGDLNIVGAKVARMTQKRPESPIGGTVLVKLTIRVPNAAFLPLRPAAVVVIPEDMTETNPVEVVAENP